MLPKIYQYGNNILNTSSYFLCWAYQTGYVLYQTAIIKLFNSTFALTILDCIYASISCILIYLISNKIFKNNFSSFLTSFLYTIGFFASAYCGVLTNQHLFTMLILISVYILIANQNISLKKSIILGLILALSNIIRTEAIIYLLGIEIYLLLNIRNRTDIKKCAINMLTILATYIIITQSASLIIQKTNINQNGLADKNVLWKFVCGLDYDSRGQYSKRGELISNDSKKELEFIFDNLKMPSNNYIKLAGSKITTFWHNVDYKWVLQEGNINIINNDINKSDLFNLVNIYDKILFIIILIFLLIYLINIITKKQIKNKELLLMMLIIINFFIYLIIEVQSRYSYTAKIFIYILAAGGINYIVNISKHVKIKRRVK